MDLTRRSFLGIPAGLAGASLVPGSLLAALEAATPVATQPTDWAGIRAQFPLARDYTHMAGFFIVSHPTPVRHAIEGYRRAIDENPFLTVEHGMFGAEDQWMQGKVMAEAAAYFGGAPEQIALTPNTTTSLALVYHGLQLKPGDEILCTVHDHNVHHESIRLSTERNGATSRRIRLFDDSASATVDGIVGRIRDSIKPATRVLGITWVHSSTGIRLPVRDISAMLKTVNADRDEADRVLMVLDGVHGLGAVDDSPVDLGCDFFCAGTHKWMFAPRGTGIIWAKADAWARVRPTIPSFSDFELYEAWLQDRAPRGPNVATRVSPGGFLAYEHQWAMAAAFKMHRDIGRARIAERITALNDRCKAGLAAIDGVTLHTPRAAALSAGVNAFEVAGHKPEAVVAKLLEQKIIASTSPYAVSYARLSAGLMNDEADVDRAVAEVAKIAKSAAAA